MTVWRYVASFGGSTALGGVIGGSLAAWRLGSQAALGAPLTHYLGFPLHAPWDILAWAPWAGSVPTIRSGLIVAAGIAALPLLGMARGLKPKFGAKEWGGMADVKKAGLLAKDGVVIGKKNGRVLRFAGDQHTLFAGASGSGKTSGPVCSSLLSLRDRSVLVLDPKGELYKMTAAFRATLGAALYYDPTDRGSARFNPLDEIEVGTDREIAAVQNIAGLLINASGLKNSDPIWPITATDLLTSLIMFALRSSDPAGRTLAAIRGMMWDMPSTLEGMALCDSAEARQVAQTMIAMTPRTADAIALTARSALSVFADPLVAEKTSRSDFRISDLVCSKYPVSLYLQVPPSDRDRLMPLFRLILLQVFKAFLWRPDHMPDGRRKLRRMQLIAEEFPAVGKIPGFDQDIQELRRYGISCMLLCQSLKSLEAIYGKTQVIRDNCHIVTCFASSDTDAMKDISTAIGVGVENKVSTSRKRGEWFGGTRSTTENRRALMDPGEVRMLDMDDAIVLVTGTKPLRVKKVRWYKERCFRSLGVDLERNPDVPLVQNETIASLQGGI